MDWLYKATVIFIAVVAMTDSLIFMWQVDVRDKLIKNLVRENARLKKRLTEKENNDG